MTDYKLKKHLSFSHNKLKHHLTKFKISFASIFIILLLIIALGLFLRFSYSNSSESLNNITNNSLENSINFLNPNLVFCNETSGISLSQCFDLINAYSTNCTYSFFNISSIIPGSPILSYSVKPVFNNSCNIQFSLYNSTKLVFQRNCIIPLVNLTQGYSSSNPDLGTKPFLSFCKSNN